MFEEHSHSCLHGEVAAKAKESRLAGHEPKTENPLQSERFMGFDHNSPLAASQLPGISIRSRPRIGLLSGSPPHRLHVPRLLGTASKRQRLGKL